MIIGSRFRPIVGNGILSVLDIELLGPEPWHPLFRNCRYRLCDGVEAVDLTCVIAEFPDIDEARRFRHMAVHAAREQAARFISPTQRRRRP